MKKKSNLKGTDIMFIGSWIVLLLAINLPREILLPVMIPFILVELTLAIFVTLRNRKVKINGIDMRN